MANGQGFVELDFGAFPGSNEASEAFTDATIGAGSKVEAYIMADDTTTDHTASDHRYAGLFINLTAAPIASTGGTIYGRSTEKLQGTFKIRYVWAD
jgi:hypothetical protein